MSNPDYLISDAAILLDIQKSFRKIEESGDCNTCARMNGCEYRPDCVELTRHNCPHYSKEESQ